MVKWAPPDSVAAVAVVLQRARWLVVGADSVLFEPARELLCANCSISGTSSTTNTKLLKPATVVRPVRFGVWHCGGTGRTRRLAAANANMRHWCRATAAVSTYSKGVLAESRGLRCCVACSGGLPMPF